MVVTRTLFEQIKRMLSEGKTIRFIRTWTGIYVIGNRRFYNINFTIKADDMEILNNDYPSDEWNTMQIDDEYKELRKAIYEWLREQALELLASKLGFKDVDEMYEKGTVDGDDYGNVKVLTDDDKIYTAVFCEYDYKPLVAKDIETYIFYKPIIKVEEV